MQTPKGKNHVQLFRRRIILVTFILVGLLVFISLATAQESDANQSQWPIGFPSADMHIENSVPVEVIQKVASYEAKRTWGNVSSICQIPCCDPNEKIVAFLVVFQLHSESDPNTLHTIKSYSTINGEIQKARKQYPAANAAFEEANREMEMLIREAENLKENRILKHQEPSEAGQIQPEVVRIPPTPQFKKAYAFREKIRKELTGAGQYGTVLVSARYDLIPIPVVSHGLPHFYIHGDVLQQKAKKAIGGNPTLKHIYFAGLLEQWYSFSNSEGKDVLVDPLKGKTYPTDEISELMPKKILMRAEPEIASKKWSILQEAIKEEKK